MPASETETSRRVLEVLRFAVPWDASVAVVGPEVASIGRRIVEPLSPELSDADAIERLEAMRAEGCEFLIVGASAYPWLDTRSGLGNHLETRYRLVDRCAESCAVYALHGAGGRKGADGLPLPPVDLIRITSGLYRRATDPDAVYRRFEATGEENAAWIGDKLAANGAAIGEFDALLDFGCGCGRVTRRWKDLPGKVHGSDYNPNLASWCAEHLGFGDFRANGAEPPLPYEDDTFDFIYSFSIFTHLDEPLQIPWMRELARVVRPGGLLLITVSGETRAQSLPRWEQSREAFEAGHLIVAKPERTGTNACAVLHPPSYVRETLIERLEVVDHEPGVPRAALQDGWLLRSPAT